MMLFEENDGQHIDQKKQNILAMSDQAISSRHSYSNEEFTIKGINNDRN